VKHALPLLAALCACSLRAPRVDSTPCSATTQCNRPSVCFLGECRGHSSALTIVEAEIQPPNNSPLGVAQMGGIDLHLSVVHDFVLVPTVAASGSVTQAQGGGAVAVAGALVTFTDHAPAIPDRVQQNVSRSDSSGAFGMRLSQGLWDVLVQPPTSPPTPPPLPPFRPPQPLDTKAPTLALLLPPTSALVPFQAALTADGGVLAGVNVTAIDSAGNALSATAAVQADGGFALYLPPDAGAFSLQVGPPPSDIDGGPNPAAAALDPFPNYDRLQPTTPSVDVSLQRGLPPVATLQGKVLDAAGAPVAAAHVYARSTDAMPWSLSRLASTAADGSYTLSLRAGDYWVEAAPAVAIDGPAVSGDPALPVSVPAAGLTLSALVCPPKVRGFGLIVRPGGGGVSANYQITATRLADHLLTARTAYTTATDSAGIWHITADPGRYRLEVVPTADSGLPRKVVQIELLPQTTTAEILLPQIAISPPLVVGGTVYSPAPAGSSVKPVVANATVSFYALDLSGHAILLASAPTKADGSYTAILPDVAQPGAAIQ
jgi:hypothetical protein